MTLIQRSGSALNLNIHFHRLFLDGIYTFEGPRPTFHRAPRPTPAELVRLLHTISHRVAGLLERQGLLVRDVDSDYLDFEPSEALDQLVGASIHYRIAIGSNAGKKALTLRTVPAQPQPFAPTLLAKQPKKTPFRTAFVPLTTTNMSSTPAPKTSLLHFKCRSEHQATPGTLAGPKVVSRLIAYGLSIHSCSSLWKCRGLVSP